jgi:hypothetical protein
MAQIEVLELNTPYSLADLNYEDTKIISGGSAKIPCKNTLYERLPVPNVVCILLKRLVYKDVLERTGSHKEALAASLSTPG